MLYVINESIGNFAFTHPQQFEDIEGARAYLEKIIEVDILEEYVRPKGLDRLDQLPIEKLCELNQLHLSYYSIEEKTDV